MGEYHLITLNMIKYDGRIWQNSECVCCGVCGTKALWYTFRQKFKKKRPLREIFGRFSPNTLRTIFWMENLTQRWAQSGSFFPKSGYLFWFLKRVWEAFSLPSPSCAPVIVVEMHQYTWIYLNAFENAWVNYSDYARALNMHDHLTYLTGLRKCIEF